jgi:hypothetical protein
MPLVLRPPGPRSGLADHLGDLGRARKRVAVAGGAFAMVAAALGLTLAACALDAAVHLPPLARAFALVVNLTAAAVVWLRGPARAIRLHTDPLAIALELEDRFPNLNDSLASAVSFLEVREVPAPGSRLRAAAVRTAERLVERHDLSRLVPTSRLWRSAWACCVVVAAAVPLALWNTGRAGVAVVRLADPFGAHPWPAKTRIEILAPQPIPHRMPKGDALEVRFVVRGEIPGHAEVGIRLDNGVEFADTYPLVESDSRTPTAGQPGTPSAAKSRREREAFAAVRIPADQIPRNFQFRVRANDGDTDWQAVTVAHPPRLVPLDGRPSPHLHVTPPEYTGLRPLDLPDAADAIEVPFGSRVRLRAATDVRSSAAVIAFSGVGAGEGTEQPAESTLASRGAGDPVVPDVPVLIGPDGRTLDVTFIPPRDGIYVLKLTDETGMTGTRSLRVQVTPDPAPTVLLVRPAAGLDPPVLVPTARFPVHVSVEDRRYAYRRVGLEYRIAPDGPVRSIPLADVQHAGTVLPALAGPVGTIRPQPTRYEGSFEFPVSGFLRDDGTPVRDGDVLILWAAADDWDDVTPGKGPGRSDPVQIRIVSKEGAEAFVLEQLGPLRKEIAAARDQERMARAKLDEVMPNPDGTLTPADREKLLAVEAAQRQVRDKVAAVRARAGLLRDAVLTNGLTGTPTGDRVEAVADGLDRLAERDLAAVGPALAEGRQLAARSPNRDAATAALEDLGLPADFARSLLGSQAAAVKKALTRAERGQQSVDDELSALLDVLAAWDGAGEIRGEARSLRDAILREAAVADRLPGRIPAGLPPSGLTPEQRDELDRAAARLDVLTERANQLIARAARLAEEKDRAALDARGRAAGIEIEVAGLRAGAATKPPGSLERDELARRADTQAAEAADLRAAADRSTAEAASLRQALTDADEAPADVAARKKALAAAGGWPAIEAPARRAAGGRLLVDELRAARVELDNNRPGQAAPLERSAAARLDRMAAALTERETESAPEQAARWKNAADQLDALAAKQFDLDRRIAEANRLPEPERTQAFKALADEQQKLADQAKALANRLTRERADAAAKDTRDAVNRMEATRDDLERGKSPGTAPREAVEKLDDARDKLDRAGANAPRAQADEQKRRVVERLTVLRDEQKKVAAEAARLQQKAAEAKGWDRDVLSEFGDLRDRERVLAAEVRLLATEFKDYPVFSRLLEDAAGGMDAAGARVVSRTRDIVEADPVPAYDAEWERAADARVRRPIDLAARRLDQVLSALVEAPDLPADAAGPDAAFVPLVAQAKALRALQAELNERTAAFDRAHPDRSKLDEFAREELKEIEDVQREIASLFALKTVADLFIQKRPMPPPRGKP